MDKSRAVCQVPGCLNEAPYKCPHCSIFFCSVVCYRAHSEECISKFAAATDDSLRGVRVTEQERSRFNSILAKFRRETADDDFLSPELIPGDVGNASGVRRSDDRRDGPPSDSESDSESHGDDNEGEDDAARLLEELMVSLDDGGKNALFTLLNDGLEESTKAGAVRTEPHSDGLKESSKAHIAKREPRGASLRQTNVNNSGNPSASSKAQAEDNSIDISSALELLVEDMEEMDLSYEEILARLPQNLVLDFQRKLQDGRINTLVETWVPWWIIDSEKHHTLHEELPPLPKEEQLIVPLDVPKRKASPFLIHSVVDILASYCFAMRQCNGDWKEDAIQTASQLWDCSAVLNEDKRYSSLKEACICATQRILQASGSATVAIETVGDAGALLSGLSDWVARALFNCMHILDGAMQEADNSTTRRQLKVRVRKVAFLLSWSLCQQSMVFTQAARGVLTHVESQVGESEEIEIAERAVRLAKSTSQIKSRITVLD